jgi:hypothetical protein
VIANDVLFSTYHWHKIWDLPAMLLANWIFPWVTKRFRSYWMGAILHVSDAPSSSSYSFWHPGSVH